MKKTILTIIIGAILAVSPLVGSIDASAKSNRHNITLKSNGYKILRNQTLTCGNAERYTFKAPVSGTYRFRSHSDIDTVGQLDTNDEFITDDDGYKNNDFEIIADLKKGETYEISVF